jgi:hypothetical protein
VCSRLTFPDSKNIQEQYKAGCFQGNSVNRNKLFMVCTIGTMSNQSANQTLTSQLTNIQSASKFITCNDQSTYQPIDQSTNRQASQPMNQPQNESSELTTKQTLRPTNQSVNERRKK